MADLRVPGKRDVTLGVITPNAATHRKYRDALTQAVTNMNASYLYWLRGKYATALETNVEAGRVPDIAQDAKPGETPARAAARLLAELARLRDYWTKYFDTFAKKLAADVADDWQRDNSQAWQGKLKRAGFDIKMQLTPSQQLILHAKVQENVALIKSIQQDYHKDIEGIVTRDFLAGRDLHSMAEKIKDRGGVSTRRAALIARDQSNKATAQMNSARQRELGLNLAVWQHSSAGKEPRHEHVKAGRERWVFDTQKGIDFGDGFGYVLPGEAINCVTGGSNIEILPGCRRLYRRRHTGHIMQIRTALGRELNVTPNHPILTGRGWIAAHLVNAGDDIVQAQHQVSGIDKMHVNQRVATAQDLFSAAALYVPTMRRPGATSQFHGDGTDSKVEIVDVDSFLPNVFDSAQCQFIAESLFSFADTMVDAAALGANCSLLERFVRLTGAPEFVISSASAILPLLKRQTSGADDICRRLIAKFHALQLEASSDDLARNIILRSQSQDAQPFGVSARDFIIGQLMNTLTRAARRWQRDARHADEFTDSSGVIADLSSGFADAATLAYKLDSVVDVSWIEFNGHVYNFETDVNWYTSDSVIIHNCRCTSRTIIPAIGREDSPIQEIAGAKPGVLGKLGPKVRKSPWSE